MASGDYVVAISEGEPTALNFARLDHIVGGSTKPELRQVIDFSGVVADYFDLPCRLLENYDGGGLTAQFVTSASSSSGGGTSAVLQAAMRRLDVDELFGDSHTYVYQTVTIPSPDEIGNMVYPEITFTDGAQIDDLVAGEAFVFRILRDPTHGSDNMLGDLEVHLKSTVIKET